MQVVKIQVEVFWRRSSKVLPNTGILMQDCMASQTRRPRLEYVYSGSHTMNILYGRRILNLWH